MGRLAFLFPGQGSQYPGMGQVLYEQSASAKRVLDQAEKEKPGLLDVCFSGPMERLTETENAQPALFAVSLAAAEMAKELGLVPDVTAGFSLGEWTACAYSGMLGFEQAFSLVIKRGLWMQECALNNPGGMAAVLRLRAEELHDLLKEYKNVYPVNYNTQEQIVVAAKNDDLDQFLGFLKANGKRFIRLNVSGAFHSPLMKEASERIKAALDNEQMNVPALPVYSNLTALPYVFSEAKTTLAAQASSRVLWADTILNMAANGVDTFLELGPGRVLSGFVTKLLPEAQVYQADNPDSLCAAVHEIRGKYEF